MPNVLAHAGIQCLVSRGIVRGVDPKWVYLGAIVPDIPWILHRLVRWSVPGIDALDLRLYFDVQASLFGSLLLCGTIALAVRSSWKVVLVLGLNSILHLLLDATQTKWANGVMFTAPFSWQMTNWGFYWPESVVTYMLTGLGLAVIMGTWRGATRQPAGFVRFSAIRAAAFAFLACAYLLVPLMLIQDPTLRASHHVRQEYKKDARTGQIVEFDRARVVSTAEGNFLMCCQPEGVRLSGSSSRGSGRVSLRGYFRSQDEFQVLEAHVHSEWFRDTASYVGLILVTLVWLNAARASLTAFQPKPTERVLVED